MQRLDKLGFIEKRDGDRLRLRAPLLRFVDPVRGLEDRSLALARLIASGQIAVPDDEDDKEPEHEHEDEADEPDDEDDKEPET